MASSRLDKITTLIKEKTAVLVIDMQNDFIEEGAPIAVRKGRSFAPRLKKFLKECRDSGMLIVYTQHIHRRSGSDLGCMSEHTPGGSLREGTPGIEIYDEVAPEEGDIIVQKHRYDACYNTDLEIILRNAGIRNVLITGVATENCCAATARGLQARDYNVIFLTDLTGSEDYPDIGYGAKSGKEIHETMCTIIGSRVGTLATSEEILNIIRA
jgi:ureidoacrylate peracid hydrolase